jgi:chromate transporter
MLGPALLVFLYIGVVSFGGGLSIVPELHRQLVEVHPWLTSNEFADGYAIGQLAPGPNMLCIGFYGYRIAGVLGGALAIVASFGPGALLSGLLGGSWRTLGRRPAIAWIRRGLVPVGVGLMASGVFVLARTSLASFTYGAIAVVVAVAVQRKLATNALAVLLAGAAGVVLELLRAT